MTFSNIQKNMFTKTLISNQDYQQDLDWLPIEH